MIIERSAGVILVLRKDGAEDKFLLIKQLSGNWSFPKGHIEDGEDAKSAAIRELQEETGITKFKFAELPTLLEEYNFNHSGDIRHKVNEYFIAYALQEDVKIQEGEIVDYKWATFNEAMETFTFDDQKVIMKEVKKYINPTGFNFRIASKNNTNLPESDLELLPRKYKARAVMVDNEGNFLLIRTPSIDKVTTPGGGMEHGETIEQAMIRECKEETGYDISILCELGHNKVMFDDHVRVSFIYLVKTIGAASELTLMQDEEEEGHEVVCLNFEDALSYKGNSELLKADLLLAKKYLEELNK